MKSVGATLEEKTFELVEVFLRDGFPHSQTKRLRHWRARTVKHRTSPRDVDPLRAHIRKSLGSCFNKPGVRNRFRAFQPARQIQIRKWKFQCVSYAPRCTANRRHSPQSGITRMPLSSNLIPEPATKSFTVPETSTSPAPDS